MQINYEKNQAQYAHSDVSSALLVLKRPKRWRSFLLVLVDISWQLAACCMSQYLGFAA